MLSVAKIPLPTFGARPTYLIPLVKFLPALKIVYSLLKPNVKASSATASNIIPAVYPKFVNRLVPNPVNPPLVDDAIADASAYAAASSGSSLKSPFIILAKLFGPEAKPLANSGAKPCTIDL